MDWTWSHESRHQSSHTNDIHFVLLILLQPRTRFKTVPFSMIKNIWIFVSFDFSKLWNKKKADDTNIIINHDYWNIDI